MDTIVFSVKNVEILWGQKSKTEYIINHRELKNSMVFIFSVNILLHNFYLHKKLVL